jgi:hypothetical protein
MPSRFVRPETVTLPISNGDSIVVKKRLTNGERRAMFARMYHNGVAPLRIDTLQTGLALVLAYLLDWSLTDENGSKVPIAGLSGEDLAAVVDSLGPDDFSEIKDAIEAHVAVEEIAEEKKRVAASGATASAATSPSAE